MESAPKDRDFQEELTRLRRTDNFTNFLFIGKTWLIIGLTIGAFVAFDLYRAAAGWHLIWDLPLFLITVVIVGASQHQLAGAGHEATHYTLFKDRILNEFVSDWFCMFPILTTTATYRKQHLAHHLHVNDPDHDPDLSQLRSSGHEFAFPMAPGEFRRVLLQQLWPPNLIRYTIHRIRYSAIGVQSGRQGGFLPDRLFFLYFFILLGTLGLLAHLEVAPEFFYLSAGGLSSIAIAMILFSPAPSKSHRPDSVFSRRTGSLLRYIHLTIGLLGITLIHVYTRLETLNYLAFLWLVPLATTFSFFMMLRQSIQHGNCDAGKFTNTRVFLVNPCLRYAVFPFGMDYHLPHHLYATVPHYRLPKLHDLLQREPEYQSPGTVASGWFFTRAGEDSRQDPTLAEVLGPDYSPDPQPESGSPSTNRPDNGPPRAGS